jgi:hypothetical protein
LGLSGLFFTSQFTKIKMKIRRNFIMISNFI